MKIIESETIGEGWLKSCRSILDSGIDIKDGDERLKEIIHLILTIKNPSVKDEIIETHGDKEMIEWMLSNFLEQKTIPELNDSQSYGIRLFNYNGKDQVQWVIEKLKRKPESKSATIPMLMPNKDSGYIPCVSLLDFKIRDDNLILTVLCRSLDFGRKAYANMVALHKIQKLVADELKVQIGALILHIISAHVYENDIEGINPILKNFEER